MYSSLEILDDNVIIYLSQKKVFPQKRVGTILDKLNVIAIIILLGTFVVTFNGIYSQCQNLYVYDVIKTT